MRGEPSCNGSMNRQAISFCKNQTKKCIKLEKMVKTSHFQELEIDQSQTTNQDTVVTLIN